MPSHEFQVVAFVQNFALRALSPRFPGAVASSHELRLPLERGEMWLFPFGAVAFLDAPEEVREAGLARLREALSELSPEAVRESFSVREEEGSSIRVEDGALVVDRLTASRAAVVATTVAQSAAMEYYERIVEEHFERVSRWIERLERRGTLPVRTRGLHRFMAEAISTRSETLTVLHLLDKPEATWDDPAMDRIYGDLRAEFDLGERYRALEAKLRAAQEALVLLVEVARDRRLLLLEVAIVLLIALEIGLGLLRLA